MDSMYAQAVSEGKDIGEAASEAIAYGVEKGLDDSKLKTAVDGFVKKADIEKALNHKDDDNWYYDQLEKIVDALGQGSELYDNFYLKLVEGRNKVADADKKANDKEAKSAKRKPRKLKSCRQSIRLISDLFLQRTHQTADTEARAQSALTRAKWKRSLRQKKSCQDI